VFGPDRVPNHLVGGAVLDRATRIQELALGPDLDARHLAFKGPQAHDRRVANEIGDFLGDAQACPAHLFRVRQLVGG